ncbi:MAG: hypothetical protein AB7V08_08475 [Elusimicrobiales bacterium]
MFDWIQTHLTALSIGAVATLAIPLAKQKLPALAKTWTSSLLTALVNPDLQDPQDREDVTTIMKAAMRIAARHMIGRGGKDKMAWVISYTCSRTGLKREDIEAIAQGVYDSIASELKAHGAPDTPAAPEVKP